LASKTKEGSPIVYCRVQFLQFKLIFEFFFSFQGKKGGNGSSEAVSFFSSHLFELCETGVR
jgi:hypothetical protein